MNREYHRWFSLNLHREMELLIFGHTGAKVLVFPTRQGRFFDYENWGLVGALSDSIDQGLIQLFCVDSLDSEALYARDSPPWAKIGRHRQFERYILEEVLPLMRSRATSASFLISHGCSIGAYHAVTLALRHPGVFGKVVALSGRYDLTKNVGYFPDLFNGYYDQDIYFYMPNHFLPQLNDAAMIGAMQRTQFTLAVGEHDSFIGSTRELSRQLADKQIDHNLAIWPGEAHKPFHWRQMVRLYL